MTKLPFDFWKATLHAWSDVNSAYRMQQQVWWYEDWVEEMEWKRRQSSR